MKKTYITPVINIIAIGKLCWSESPFGNSVEHGSAKGFDFEEDDDWDEYENDFTGKWMSGNIRGRQWDE